MLVMTRRAFAIVTDPNGHLRLDCNTIFYKRDKLPLPSGIDGRTNHHWIAASYGQILDMSIGRYRRLQRDELAARTDLACLGRKLWVYGANENSHSILRKRSGGGCRWRCPRGGGRTGTLLCADLERHPCHRAKQERFREEDHRVTSKHCERRIDGVYTR